MGSSYIIFLGLLVIVVILAEIIIILVIFVLKFAFKIVLVNLLVCESLAGEPVDGTGDELLLDILAELVVQFEALLDVRGSVVVVLSRSLGRGEEVEERLGGDGLLDDAGLLRVYSPC